MSAPGARLAAALLLVGTFLAGCGDEPERRPDRARLPTGPARDVPFGFNDNGPLQGIVSAERDAQLAAGAGATVIRLTLDWRGVENTPGAYDFAPYDAVYRALRRHGIRPLWVVAFAPQWAWDADVRCAGDCHVPPSRAAEGDWERLLERVAERYPRSAGIELWNEPNYSGFFYPEADAARYTRLQKLGYRAVKRVRPDLPVVNGGLANFLEADSDRVPMEEFLDAIYQEGGGRYMDGVSVHPYPGSPTAPVMLTSVAAARRAMARHGDHGKPLWLTEIGATTTGRPELSWSDDEQADELVAAYDRLRRVPGIDMFLVHTLIDPEDDDSNPEAGYGILERDYSPKPAYCRFARRLRGSGC